MLFFNRKPPPPSPKIPIWIIQILTPLIMTIILGLIAFIGSGFSEDIKDIKIQVEKVDEKKVDNETLKFMIQKQELLIEHQQTEAERQRKQDAEKFDQIQRTQTKTLERIEEIAIQTPRQVSIKSPPAEVIKQNSSVILTPDEFDRYMKMDENTKLRYKKYLEESGKDVIGLP